MTTQPDLDKLAKSLTAAQRDVFSRAQQIIFGDEVIIPLRNGAITRVVQSLRRKGLCEPLRANVDRLTPLGLALRNHLKQQERADGR